MNIGWNKFRILVTNRCNYRCPFCHNEGQDKSVVQEQMTFDDFKSFVDIIANLHISEINFSGGEPFLNPEIVDMILYANNKLTGDISCATNLSLITTNMIERLANTRLKFNIQFPYINESAFIKSTGNGSLSRIKSNIKAVKEAGIKIGLNTVIQSRKIEAIIEMTEFAIQNELPLKLLPQIGLEGSDKFKDQIYPILNRYATTIYDKGTGATVWNIEKNGHRTRVLYIDSPCFNSDIQTCRAFGELRILPGMYAQPCILKEPQIRLDLSKGDEYILNQLAQLWNDFTTC